MATKKKMLQAAAGQATGGAGLDITDVFSTYLYDGNSGSAQTITNNIDLSGEGGLVWIKPRNENNYHSLQDTVATGLTKHFYLPLTSGTFSDSQRITAFNSNGFTLGTQTDVNGTQDFVSWTFRKAPKFFDVVTYTGTNATRTLNHNLGSVPGCIMFKNISEAGNWEVVFPNQGSNDFLYGYLNLTGALSDMSYAVAVQNNVVLASAPTSTSIELTPDDYTGFNKLGSEYVAYLFAHNDGDGEFGPDGDQDIIKCGSYTGNGSTDGPEIDLGFEPQWILLKNTTNCNWRIMDTMRGLPVDGIDAEINPNLSNAESTGISGKINISASGFKLVTTDGCFNNSGVDFIYMAIRRGPLAQPESGTEVFDVDAETNLNTFVTTPWPTDLAIQKDRQQANQWVVYDRMRGGSNILNTASNSAENTGGTGSYFSGMDYMDGIDLNFFSSDASNNVVYNWKRAPGFFDVVAYTGTGSVMTVNHNLGVAPEMMWVKCRSNTKDWAVYHSDLGSTNEIRLNATSAAFGTTAWNNTTPTDSVFTLGVLGRVNSAVTEDYIAYLFATLPGISKVGSYTGNGSSQTIDCGFTSGARFVLIKRANDIGSWWVFDTERGIVAGDDKYLKLNDTSAEGTAQAVDPYSGGFGVNTSGLSSINGNGDTFIFYAIA